MSFQDAVRTCLQQKFADFSGRARRSEYWWFALFGFAAQIVASILNSILHLPSTGTSSLLGTLVSLALLVPGLAAAGGVGLAEPDDPDELGHRAREQRHADHGRDDDQRDDADLQACQVHGLDSPVSRPARPADCRWRGSHGTAWLRGPGEGPGQGGRCGPFCHDSSRSVTTPRNICPISSL